MRVQDMIEELKTREPLSTVYMPSREYGGKFVEVESIRPLFTGRDGDGLGLPGEGYYKQTAFALGMIPVETDGSEED